MSACLLPAVLITCQHFWGPILNSSSTSWRLQSAVDAHMCACLPEFRSALWSASEYSTVFLSRHLWQIAMAKSDAKQAEHHLDLVKQLVAKQRGVASFASEDAFRTALQTSGWDLLDTSSLGASGGGSSKAAGASQHGGTTPTVCSNENCPRHGAAARARAAAAAAAEKEKAASSSTSSSASSAKSDSKSSDPQQGAESADTKKAPTSTPVKPKQASAARAKDQGQEQQPPQQQGSSPPEKGKSSPSSSTTPSQTAAAEPAQTCANPGCSRLGTKRCGGCKLVSYCSVECQRTAWPRHKASCSKS